jgi:hypothetical protein
MKLDMTAQREYCVALGLIAADDWGGCYTDPQARQVTRLLEAMEAQAGKIGEAARWMRSAMDAVDTRFAGDHVHSVNLNACGEVARQAIDYDMAVAAYMALQDQLRQVVIGIRRGQGYEPGAFDHLEDHPALTAEQDQARRDLAALELHLAHGSMSPTAMRRHLAEVHHRQVTRAPGLSRDEQMAQLDAIHDEQHAGELAALRAAVAEIDPNLLIALASGRAR